MSNLHITSPCAADWKAMTPAAAGRHCAECGKDVVDLTCLSLTERDSALKRLELVIATGRSMCVRAPTTNDGRIAGRSLHRRVLTGGMATVLAVAMAGCQGEGPVTSTPGQQAPVVQTQQTPVQQAPVVPEQQTPVVEPLQMMMGAIAMPPPDAPPPGEVIKMGKTARVDPVENPVVPLPEPSAVAMGEICIMPAPAVAPVTVPPSLPASPSP